MSNIELEEAQAALKKAHDALDTAFSLAPSGMDWKNKISDSQHKINEVHDEMEMHKS